MDASVTTTVTDKRNPDISSGHITQDIFPGQLPLDNFSFLLRGVGHFPLHHHHPQIYTIKRSIVNVYKIDKGRSIMVRSTG